MKLSAQYKRIYVWVSQSLNALLSEKPCVTPSINVSRRCKWNLCVQVVRGGVDVRSLGSVGGVWSSRGLHTWWWWWWWGTGGGGVVVVVGWWGLPPPSLKVGSSTGVKTLFPVREMLPTWPHTREGSTGIHVTSTTTDMAGITQGTTGGVVRGRGGGSMHNMEWGVLRWERREERVATDWRLKDNWKKGRGKISGSILRR